jgi:hypothetical protein
MRRRKCLRYHRATRGHRGVGRSTCTRPEQLARGLSVWNYTAYVDYRVCRAREQQFLVLRQTEAEHAAFVCMDDSAALIRVETIDLLWFSFYTLRLRLRGIQVSLPLACQQKCTATRLPGPICSYHASCDAPTQASYWRPQLACPRHSPLQHHGPVSELPLARSAWLPQKWCKSFLHVASCWMHWAPCAMTARTGSTPNPAMAGRGGVLAAGGPASTSTYIPLSPILPCTSSDVIDRENWHMLLRSAVLQPERRWNWKSGATQLSLVSMVLHEMEESRRLRLCNVSLALSPSSVVSEEDSDSPDESSPAVSDHGVMSYTAMFGWRYQQMASEAWAMAQFAMFMFRKPQNAAYLSALLLAS